MDFHLCAMLQSFPDNYTEESLIETEGALVHVSLSFTSAKGTFLEGFRHLGAVI